MKITVEKIGGTDTLFVDERSTVADVVQLSTGEDIANYTVNVNDAPASAGDRLTQGALVSIVPKKVDGA